MTSWVSVLLEGAASGSWYPPVPFPAHEQRPSHTSRRGPRPPRGQSMVAHVGQCSNIRAFMPSGARVPHPEEASGTSDQEECAEKSQKAKRKQTDLNSNTLL